MNRRLGRAAEQAAHYKDIAGPEWGPRVAALVCCARFLEHHLREGPPQLLLLDLQVLLSRLHNGGLDKRLATSVPSPVLSSVWCSQSRPHMA